MPINDWLDADRRLDEEGLRKKIIDTAIAHYEEKRAQMGEENAMRLERDFMLRNLDRHWKEHLTQMDHLRKGIHLRCYAQKNPEQEYKRESFELFRSMLGAIKSDVVQDLARVHIPTAEEIAQMEEARRLEAEQIRMRFEHSGSDDDNQNLEQPKTAAAVQHITLNLGNTANAQKSADILPEALPEDVEIPSNISRNAPCPCGSGLKYKQCHGKLV